MMKMSLRGIVGLIVIVMMLALAGCGVDVEEQSTESTGKKTTTEESSKKTTEEDSAGKTTEASSNKQTTTQGTTQQTTTQSATTQNTSSNTTQASAQSTTQTTTSTPATTHEHNWTPVYKTIHHEEEGHYEEVEVAPAYTYDNYEVHTCCNGCGYDYTVNDPNNELYQQYMGCPVCGSGGYSGRQVYVGKVTVPAITEKTYIKDKDAYDEKVIDYYECSKCHATK